MKNIEIGEYIRDKFDRIGKVLEVNCGTYKTKKFGASSGEILKHSYNILNLLEPGDIVNGFTIDEFDDIEGNLYLGIPIFDDALMDVIVDFCPLDSIEIKTILTHQQYDKDCYEVE